MEIRVIKEPEGILPGLMPEVGKIYQANKGKSAENGGRGRPFCWIEINGKKIVLREGEYSVVKDDPSEEEKKVEEIKMPKKPGPKPKPKEPPKVGGLHPDPAELLDALAAERARSRRLERALLALTLEHYGA